jgi:hypothetical protein
MPMSTKRTAGMCGGRGVALDDALPEYEWDTQRGKTTPSPRFIQLTEQERAAVRSYRRTLEVNRQPATERELEGPHLPSTHWSRPPCAMRGARMTPATVPAFGQPRPEFVLTLQRLGRKTKLLSSLRLKSGRNNPPFAYITVF